MITETRSQADDDATVTPTLTRFFAATLADNVTRDNNVSDGVTAALPTSSNNSFSLVNVLSILPLIISVVGVVANSVVLAVLVLARRHFGSNVNTLITNQTAMDLVSCMFVVAMMLARISNAIVYRGNQVADNIICLVVDGLIFVSVAMYYLASRDDLNYVE